ncbi:uncharacterized protein LOC121524544 [Cheilinus undulatus]|uniref:uncharacterized protein LOC121524544 n=1 Tax=Cheilinus undulatus TaxID=241271 RepID=UPI001BD3D1A1|nr:uncharacterized protein LOC121524544 [Cheilinus undulatus]
MRIFHDSAPRLLHLLLLIELFVLSSSHPIHRSSLCSVYKSMSHHVDRLMDSAKRLHDLTDDELINFEGAESKLDSLPHIPHTAVDLRTIKVNESLARLLNYSQSFQLHVDWLKTARENVSLPFQPAESASTHLLQLSKLIKTSLQQINEEAPPPPSASLPVVSSAFEALQFSVEISGRLQGFGHWSKRVLQLLRSQSHCPRH